MFFKYDDFFDGDDDDLLYLTQVAEIETGLAQSSKAVNSTTFNTFNVHQHNTTKVNKPAVPKTKKADTNRKLAVTGKQTKISDMLGPSTSMASFSSSAVPTRNQNDRTVESNSATLQQTLGKRIATSPLHTETKRPSVEFQESDVDWDDMDVDMDIDVNISNPLVKVFSSASVIKNSKIQVKQNEWICSGIVMDGTTKHEVEFSSEVSCR